MSVTVTLLHREASCLHLASETRGPCRPRSSSTAWCMPRRAQHLLNSWVVSARATHDRVVIAHLPEQVSQSFEAVPETVEL
jgi:hypothetical protein